MADIKTASYAVAGTGEVDEGNAASLLDNHLPQHLGAVYRPQRVPRSNKSLSAVINWLESPDILGSNGTVASENLVEDLLARKTAGDDVTLIVVWPSEPGEDDLALAKAAFDAKIPVKNLAAALDDLIEDEVFPPPLPTKPEPQAEDTPPFDPPYTNTETGEVTEAADVVAAQLASHLTETLEQFIRRVVRQEMGKANGAEPATPAKTRKPRATRAAKPTELPDGASSTPKFSGDNQSGAGDEEKVAYYVNEDGEYRKAKTRPRRGETRVMLTLEEVDRLVEEGKIPIPE